LATTIKTLRDRMIRQGLSKKTVSSIPTIDHNDDRNDSNRIGERFLQYFILAGGRDRGRINSNNDYPAAANTSRSRHFYKRMSSAPLPTAPVTDTTVVLARKENGAGASPDADVVPELLFTVDTHTLGEPTRVIIGAEPKLEIPGSTMSEKREHLSKQLDNFRRAVMLEPRGHDDMFWSHSCSTDASKC